MFDKKADDFAELAAAYSAQYGSANPNGQFPATQTIRNHFQVLSFVPPQFADPACKPVPSRRSPRRFCRLRRAHGKQPFAADRDPNSIRPTLAHRPAA
jgi:hypothetical protein